MANITPTRHLVVDALCKAGGPLTPGQISNRVERSLRSIRDALRELEMNGDVSWRTDIQDARRRLYFLTENTHNPQHADPNRAGTQTTEPPCDPSHQGSSQ